MKVKQIKQRGEQVWLVDGRINSKRKRMFFESEAKASLPPLRTRARQRNDAVRSGTAVETHAAR